MCKFDESEYKCLRFSSLPLSVMMSVAAQRPPAMLTICCGLLEATFGTVAVRVVHPGKPNIQKGRRVVS